MTRRNMTPTICHCCSGSALGKESIKVKTSLLSMELASPRSLLAASMSLSEGREAGGLVSIGGWLGEGLGLQDGNRAVCGLWLPGAPREKARIGPNRHLWRW